MSNRHLAKGKEGDPPDKLPPPEDIDDDGSDDAVPIDPEEEGE